MEKRPVLIGAGGGGGMDDSRPWGTRIGNRQTDRCPPFSHMDAVQATALFLTLVTFLGQRGVQQPLQAAKGDAQYSEHLFSITFGWDR